MATSAVVDRHLQAAGALSPLTPLPPKICMARSATSWASFGLSDTNGRYRLAVFAPPEPTDEIDPRLYFEDLSDQLKSVLRVRRYISFMRNEAM